MGKKMKMKNLQQPKDPNKQKKQTTISIKTFIREIAVKNNNKYQVINALINAANQGETEYTGKIANELYARLTTTRKDIQRGVIKKALEGEQIEEATKSEGIYKLSWKHAFRNGDKVDLTCFSPELSNQELIQQIEDNLLEFLFISTYKARKDKTESIKSQETTDSSEKRMDQKKKDIILLFMDMEGTLTEKGLGEIKGEDFERLLDEIVILQAETNAQVKIHLISPIQLEYMEKTVDMLDSYIGKYNFKNKSNISDIQSATATFPIGISEAEYDKIFPFPQTARIENLGAAGKRKCVKDWCEYYPDSLFCIYAGNGRNDLQAMMYLKQNKKNRILCPGNSRAEVKKIADYTSDEENINGIIDAMQKLNRDLKDKKRLGVEKTSGEQR